MQKTGPQWAKNEDKRITRIGKIIRATRIDELPQLLAVLEGTMSLIGPRPERPEIEEKFLKEIPFYKYRTILSNQDKWLGTSKPPLRSQFRRYYNKLLRYILYKLYIFLFDLLILVKTIKTVLNAKGYESKVRK